MKSTKTILLIFLFFIITCPGLLFLLDVTHAPYIIIPAYSLISIGYIIILLKTDKNNIYNFYENERQMLYSILDDVNALIYVWSEDLKICNVNDCFYQKTGYSEKFLSNKKDFKNIFVFEKGAFFDPKQTIQCKLVCADKSEMTVRWKSTLIKDGRKKIYISIGLDVTEVAIIQDKLTASEKRFELSMELSEIGLLFRYVGADNFYISSNFQKLLGLSSQIITIDEFESKIHPNDLGVYYSYLKNIKDGNFNNYHEIMMIELRLECSDGGYHWFDYRFKVSNYAEDGTPFIGGCFIDISKDKEKDTLIEKMAYIDEVSQIFNRNKFIMLGEETFECSRELGVSYWVIILDVDKFHLINDTCGYGNGNRLLKEIAISMIRNLSDGGFCARIGGDNFAILIKDIGDEEYPVSIIKNIQHSLASLNSDIFSNQTITVSSGYCKMPEDGKDFAEVFEHAEFALRLSEKPRSNIVRYDNSIHDKIINRSTLEKALEKALYSNELKLFYQPKINLTNNTIIGGEALIRWIKPDGTIVPPCDFIPIAENSNLITKISEFVVNQACEQNKKWQNKGLKPISISVNLTSTDFYQTDVCKTINDAIQKSGLSPEWLEIELTESLALKDVDQAIRQMNDLLKIGVKISMDDFGTGYSSLSYIQVLPITLLKLDRSFIMNLESDEVSRQIVSSVINICKSKKIEIIAEGIETSQQAEILRQSGCDHAQGYFFGKPMKSEDFEKYLERAN